MALLPGLCSVTYADPGSLAEGEAILFELINQARENPRATAESLGIDPDGFIADLPEMEDIITSGPPPLTLNERLRAAAVIRAADTVAECCDGAESSDGRALARRIADEGYMAVETGETVGIIAFANFIEPAAAARLLFEEMFRGEMDAGRVEPRAILNPDLEEIGIVLGTGTLSLGRLSYNLYAAACDFGTAADAPGLQLFNLINQARVSPLDTAVALGMDTESLLGADPLLAEVLTTGLSPLAFDARLYTAARGHARDMLETGYHAAVSPDGATHEDRIRAAGYEATDAAEAIGLACRVICDEPGEPPALFLERLFARDIESEPGAMTLLNPLLLQAGVSLAGGTSVELGGICGDEVVLMTADFGAEAERPAPFLAGVTYVDKNENGRYDAGEGAPAAISVAGPGDEMSRALRSGETGYFSLPLGDPAAAGLYGITIRLDGDGREFTRSVEIRDESVQVFIGAPPPETETAPSE
jgi:hypothetical protein